MSNILLQFVASAWKEFLLLFRDRSGLLVLFLMPAALVIIVTLVQENVMELTGEKNSEILFLDQDQGIVGKNLKEAIIATGNIKLVEMDNVEGNRKKAVSMVADGTYQVCVIVPSEISEELFGHIKMMFDREEMAGDMLTSQQGVLDSIFVYFDPGVMPGFRSGILAVLRMAAFKVEMNLKINAFEKNISQLIDQLKKIYGERIAQPVLGSDSLPKNILLVAEETAGTTKSAEIHSAVQYNVPAWSLFAMFFISIPLAASFIFERRSGVWQRLKAMPVSYVTILAGKIMSSITVCFLQIIVIFVIGRFLFPYFGLPAFYLSGHFFELTLIIFCCSLAACGYGILLGSVCSTLEQASMFGAISIVIAAALGGTMVPVYAMPRIMQHISEISPLNWGLEAMQDVLVRDAFQADTSVELIKLILFFLVALSIAWRASRLSNSNSRSVRKYCNSLVLKNWFRKLF